MNKSGIFFFCEGDTEVIFYKALIDFLCKDVTDDYRMLYNDLGELYYELKINESDITIVYKSVNTISSMNSSAPYFKGYYNGNSDIKNWTVFLCYDVDTYKNEITQFFEDDWKEFRNELLKNGDNIEIIDLSAKAEIEDIMLLDIDSIRDFLGVDYIEIPTNYRGKGKMKNIFRNYGKYYHEGKKSEKLVNSLNFNLIIDKAELPLIKVKEKLLGVNS